MGLALSGLGRDAEAVGSYDRAVALDPLNSLFQTNRLWALVSMRRVDSYATAVAQWRATHENSALPYDRTDRYALFGELPQSAGAMSPADAILWGWRARRLAELPTLIEKALVSEKLAEDERCELLLRRTLVWRRLNGPAKPRSPPGRRWRWPKIARRD